MHPAALVWPAAKSPPRRDSDFYIPRRARGSNEGLTLTCPPRQKRNFLANRTGLPLSTWRQYRHVDAGLLAPPGIPPRWRYRHCGWRQEISGSARVRGGGRSHGRTGLSLPDGRISDKYREFRAISAQMGNCEVKSPGRIKALLANSLRRIIRCFFTTEQGPFPQEQVFRAMP